MTTTPDALLNEIRQWLRERVAETVSLRRLAAAAGLSAPCLLGFEREDWNPTIRSLRKLDAIRGRWDGKLLQSVRPATDDDRKAA